MRGGDGEEQEAHGGETEQEITGLAQSKVERAKSGPYQDGALDREEQGDPFTVEANRDRQGSKGECESAEDQSRQGFFALLRGGWNPGKGLGSGGRGQNN